MFRKTIIQVLAGILLVAAACRSDPVPVVLVSEDYDNRFAEWLPMAGRQCKPVNMYRVSADSIPYYLSMADGIIISGDPMLILRSTGKLRKQIAVSQSTTGGTVLN